MPHTNSEPNQLKTLDFAPFDPIGPVQGQNGVKKREIRPFDLANLHDWPQGSRGVSFVKNGRKLWILTHLTPLAPFRVKMGSKNGKIRIFRLPIFIVGKIIAPHQV